MGIETHRHYKEDELQYTLIVYAPGQPHEWWAIRPANPNQNSHVGKKEYIRKVWKRLVGAYAAGM